MLLFGGDKEEERDTRYDRENWENFPTHKNWLRHKAEQERHGDFLRQLHCSGTAKVCSHCRYINRLEQKLRHARVKPSDKAKCWFAGMPFSRKFSAKEPATVKPKYTAPITKYEAMLARHCDVPYMYIMDITRADRESRRLRYPDIVDEARRNKNYRRLVENVLGRSIGPKTQSCRVQKLQDMTKEEVTDDSDYIVVAPKVRKTPMNVGWVEEDGQDINARINIAGLDQTCKAVARYSVLYLMYKRNFKLSTIRKVLTYYKSHSHHIFSTYEGKTFNEIRQAEKEQAWVAKIKAAAPNSDTAALWIKKYWLKPLREILIVTKTPDIRRERTPMSDFQRKVKYYKDGGVIARATEGLSFDEVKAQRAAAALEARVAKFFKDPSMPQKYPGLDVDAIKIKLLQNKYPAFKDCDNLSDMKAKIANYKEKVYIDTLSKRYPGAKIMAQSAAEAAKAVDEYRKTIEYGVTAYFKDAGAMAKKYPGKTVPEIKEEQLAARLARKNARENLRSDIVKGASLNKTPLSCISIDLTKVTMHKTAVTGGMKAKPRFVNVTRDAVEWDSPIVPTQEKEYAELFPSEAEFTELPEPSRPLVQHASLVVAEKMEPKPQRKAPYEKKCTIKYHIGSVPFWNKSKQLVQSYSADVWASAGFAKISASRYPKNFREKLREQKPELGSAYQYENVEGKTDVCLITKPRSNLPKSELVDVEKAIEAASKICKKNIMMPKIETGCNKQKWEDIEPLIKKYFKGKTVHVYSREAPENYGNEAFNGKNIVQHRRINVASKGAVVAYCKHSVNMVPVVDCERDLVVAGATQEEFIQMVLSGQFDTVIKNRNAQNLRPGKSGVLMKECWTKNSECIEQI